jgi:hypothetical protein
MLNAVYIGPKEEGLAHLKPLLDLDYIKRNITQLQWNQVFNAHMFGTIAQTCEGGHPENNWSTGMAKIDVPTHVAYFNALAELWATHEPAANAILSIEVFSPKTAEKVPDWETAYPYRDTGVQM